MGLPEMNLKADSNDRKIKILIADDDAATRLIYQKILVKWGYSVVSVSNGTEAWDALQQQDAPKVVLLDWEMPGLDGLEVCRRVRQLRSSTPIYVIMLTGRNTPEDTVEGFNAGADDYIAKPFDTQELQARIRVAERMVTIQLDLAEKIEDLEHALAHVQMLQGIIPICMHCHKIRKDDEAWDRLEDYIERYSDARFSHGICPECRKAHYPNIDFDSED
ncbi:MAG: response regulator transcription factor [Deltaproteobacteria bacterium]|nr:response regulator transcription factor [Deltaproteobacteria bacterium]